MMKKGQLKFKKIDEKEGEVTSLSESSQGEVGRFLGEVNCD
jgi:hypothetical protein